MKSWIDLFRSRNPTIRARAAKAMLDRDGDLPLPLLLEMLDDYYHLGLGARIERLLKTRRDPELLPEMIQRLSSPDYFVREVACGVLGQLGDASATPHLLRTLSDPHMMVRRAAGFALGHIKDKRCIRELLQRYKASLHDNVNVRMPMAWALHDMGVKDLPDPFDPTQLYRTPSPPASLSSASSTPSQKTLASHP